MNDTVAQGTQKIQEGILMVQKLWEAAVVYLVKYGFQVLGGIIILVVGTMIANWTARLFVRFGVRRSVRSPFARSRLRPPFHSHIRNDVFSTCAVLLLVSGIIQAMPRRWSSDWSTVQFC